MIAQVWRHSLADLNLCNCVELTFFEGRLGTFLYVNVLKMEFLNLLHFESESRINSDEKCL